MPPVTAMDGAEDMAASPTPIVTPAASEAGGESGSFEKLSTGGAEEPEKGTGSAGSADQPQGADRDRIKTLETYIAEMTKVMNTMKSDKELMDQKYYTQELKVTQSENEKLKKEENTKTEEDKKQLDEIKGFDYKNAPKPSSYDYDEKDYYSWYDLFIAMLSSYDSQWEQILDHVPTNVEKAIGKEEIIKIKTELDMTDEVYENVSRFCSQHCCSLLKVMLKRR